MRDRVDIRSILFITIMLLSIIVGAQEMDRNGILNEIALADSLLEERQDSLAKVSIDKIVGSVDYQGDDELFLLYHKLLGDYYLGTSQYQESVEAYEELAKISTDFDRELSLKLARAINDLGIAYMKVGRIDDAINAHKNSQVIYDKYNEPQGGSYNYNNLAIIYKELKKIDSAIYFHNQSIKYAILANDSLGIGFNHLNIGMLKIDNKDPILAMDHFQKALKVFEDIDNESLIVATKRRVGRTYSMLKDFESAVQIQKETLAYYSDRKSKSGLARVHLDIGELLLKLNKFDSAKHHIDRSIVFNSEINYLKGIVNGHNLLGQYYRAVKDFSSATVNYNKSYELSKGKFLGMEANNLKGLAEISFTQGSYREAISLATQSLDKTDHSASLSNLSGTYEVLYKSHKELGNEAEALRYLELYNEKKDLIFGEDQSLEIARIEYRNQLEREEAAREAEQLQKDLLFEQQLTREKWIRYGAIAFALLISVIAFFAYNGYQIKKKANKELGEKNEKLKELRASEKKSSEEAIASKERELATMAMSTHEKNNLLSDLEQKVSFIEARIGDEMKPSLKEIKKTISEGYSLDKSWDSFIHRFEDVHPQFFDKLKDENPVLTVEDLKLSAYLKIGMSNKEIANVTHLTLGSVKSKINRLKKKLEMGPDDSLRDYMLKYA